MAKFVSKYWNYTVKIRNGRKEMVNGNVVRTSPVRIHFRNGSFDTKSEQAQRIPMSETEIIERLRKAPSYNKNFYELGRNPKTAEDLLEVSIRDLQGALEDVDDPAMIKEAQQKDERESADKYYEQRMRQL